MTPEVISLGIESRLDSVSLLASAIRGVAAYMGLDPEKIDELEIAVVEAVTNVVVHGNVENTERPISVGLVQMPDGIEVIIHDQGASIPEEKIKAARNLPDLAADTPLEDLPLDGLSEGGRGLALIWGCVDRVDYRSGPEGNSLRLYKKN